jgi:hypothetical protein
VRCAVGSWGGRRPSGGYVTGTEATRGATAAGVLMFPTLWRKAYELVPPPVVIVIGRRRKDAA